MQTLSILGIVSTALDHCGPPVPETFRPPSIQVSSAQPGGPRSLDAGSYDVTLDGVPTAGAQFLRVAVDPLVEDPSAPPPDPAPVRVNWTDRLGASSSVAVPPGGEVRLFLPGTTNGPVSLQLVLTLARVCRVSFAG